MRSIIDIHTLTLTIGANKRTLGTVLLYWEYNKLVYTGNIPITSIPLLYKIMILHFTKKFSFAVRQEEIGGTMAQCFIFQFRSARLKIVLTRGVE